MKEIRKQIIVPRRNAQEITRVLNTVPKNEKGCFTEDQSITYTADFGNGIEMDVKVCGVSYEEGESNKPYTEAVLFRNGYELCHTEPDEDFFGDWKLEHEGITYIAEVVMEPEKHIIWDNDVDKIRHGKYTGVKQLKHSSTDEVYHFVDNWFYDAVNKLDIDMNNNLALTGMRNNSAGIVPAYQLLPNTNISDALKYIRKVYNTDYLIQIYVQGEYAGVIMNHRISGDEFEYELRLMTANVDDLKLDISTEVLMRNSKAIGNIVNKACGWDEKKAKVPVAVILKDSSDVVLPLSIRQHINDGGRIYLIAELENNKAVISVSCNPTGTACTVVDRNGIEKG